MTVRQSPREGLPIAAATAAILALLAALTVLHPFTGDQALFADGARRMGQGAVYSRDVWDVKQPGIYLLYLAGGALGGYSSVWLYAFEGILLAAFGAFLVVVLRDEFARPWISAVVPLAGLGVFLATIEPLQHGQVESVVGIPLFLSLWCAARAPESGAPRRGWLAAAGLAGGVALVVKLVLAPIVLAHWYSGAFARRDRGGRGMGRDLAALACGAAIPLGLVIAYFAAHGELGRVWWTTVEVTPQTTGIAGRPVSRLVDGAATTAFRWALPMVLGVIGFRSRRDAGWSRLDRGCAWWIALGVPVFLIQHWWIYQYALFVVPLGWFAARGVEHFVLTGPSGRHRLLAGIALAVLVVPVAYRVGRNAEVVASNGFGLTGDDRERIRRELEPQYADAAKWADFVGRRPRRGDTQYVLGNPLLAYRAALAEPVAINGWSPEQNPDEVWDRLRAQLDRERPRFLAVDWFSRGIVRERSPITWRWIRHHYRAVAGAGEGSDAVDFYRLRSER